MRAVWVGAIESTVLSSMAGWQESKQSTAPRGPRDGSSPVRGRKVVLIVDYFFPPLGGAGVQRTLGYIRHLKQHGWMPVVLTVSNGTHTFFDRSLLERVPPDVEVKRTFSFEPVGFVRNMLTHGIVQADGLKNNGSHRLWKFARMATGLQRWIFFPDRRLGWLPLALSGAVGVARRHSVDVIYSTSTAVTSHLVAYILKKWWNKPWIADFQDPWIEGNTELPSLFHRWLARGLEYRIIREADRVTVTTDGLKRLLERSHPSIPAAKTEVIPMGFEPDVFARLARVPRAKFGLVHFGNFYGARSPGPFLEALADCLDQRPDLRGDIEVLFLGGFEPRLRALTVELLRVRRLEDVVKLADSVPYQTGVQELVSSDVLLLMTGSGPWGENLVPSKLYEYLAAGRPILAAAPEGPAARLVREARAGFVVGPDDVVAIREALSALYDAWKTGRSIFSSDPSVVRRFSYAEITARFASVLDDALTAKRPGSGRRGR